MVGLETAGYDLANEAAGAAPGERERMCAGEGRSRGKGSGLIERARDWRLRHGPRLRRAKG